MENWTTLRAIVKNIRPAAAIIYEMRPLIDAPDKKLAEINDAGADALDKAAVEICPIKAEALRATGNMMLDDSVREISLRN